MIKILERINIQILPKIEYKVEHSYDLETSIFVCATENISKEQSKKFSERLKSLTPLFSKLKWEEEKIDDISELINYVKKRKAAIGAFDLDEHDTSHEDSEIAILKESIEKSRYEIKIKFNAEFDISQRIIKHIIKLQSLLVESLEEEFYKILKEKVHFTLQTKFTHHLLFDSQNSRGYEDTVTEITSRIYNKKINTYQDSRTSFNFRRGPPPKERLLTKTKRLLNEFKTQLMNDHAQWAAGRKKVAIKDSEITEKNIHTINFEQIQNDLEPE